MTYKYKTLKEIKELSKYKQFIKQLKAVFRWSNANLINE